MRQNANVGERVSALEQDVRHLSNEIAGIKTEMSAGFSSIRNAINDQKTPLTQLAGWASVILVIVGAVLFPLFQADSRFEQAIQELAMRHVDHIDDGHPQSTRERVNENTQAIKELDVVLQREMRLLDEATLTRLDHLDKKLQRELELMTAQLTASSEAQKEGIRELKTWQHTIGGRMLLNHASQEARIKALEGNPQEQLQ